ncbi:MAG TPA: MBL fold metallo-hydrolase [Clostridia bacterium]|mgnify:CR=1 FL=1|jgi:7,8-dihydropterin-6-yl-methyl-4-(beta-D-ribofuranosyl)aminobenzene 5'-phosphate synthase|nr:MBL fold metallo-hydrolase [Clostridia bacterium]
MKIVSLVDNVSNRESLGSEHGLSLYIETKKHKLLFDTGASSLFMENAKALGVDLKKVDIVILSHGHYDHGGGLKAFLDINDKANIYVKKEAFGDYYSERPSGIEYIGLDKSLSKNPQIKLVDGDLVIDDELRLFSSVKIIDERFSTNKRLKLLVGQEYKEDNFIHEQNLVISLNYVKILIAGCAHNGITNIIKRFIGIVGKEPDYVISGFHLSGLGSGKDEDTSILYELGAKLNKYHSKYYTCHCTGIEPYEKLKEVLNNKLEYFATGDMLNVK